MSYFPKFDEIEQLREKFGLMDAILSHLCISLDEEPERIAEEEGEKKKTDFHQDSTAGKEIKAAESKDSEDKIPEENAEKSEEKEESITDEVEEST